LYIQVIVILFLHMGCAGALQKNYGSITPDGNVSAAFESYKIDPQLNYYISGSDLYPNALMGLKKTYTLDSDLWKKIEPAAKDFREIIQYMQKRALDLGQHQFGFAILDDNGKQIGIWYSILSARTSVRMKEENKVVIITPDLDTYEKLERDGRFHIKKN
jgi:hypothetical protein